MTCTKGKLKGDAQEETPLMLTLCMHANGDVLVVLLTGFRAWQNDRAGFVCHVGNINTSSLEMYLDTTIP